MIPHQFDGFFPCKMLHAEFNHAYAASGFGYLVLQSFFMVWIITVAKKAKGTKFLFFITDDTYTPESNDATEVCGVFRRMDLITVNDAERSLIAMGNGFNLMSLQCRMEVELPIAIDIADGYRVGIAVCVEQGKGAGSVSLDHLNGLLLGELLALAAHRCEFGHGQTSFSPITEMTSVVMKNNRQNVTGS